MLFNSFQFLLLFLPPVFALSLALKGNRLLAWITLASVAFYSFAGHVWFIGPMLVTICLDFAIGIWMARSSRVMRKVLLVTSLTANFGLLFYFKYSSWLLSGLQLLFKSDAVMAFQTILPAGISFYTFQSVSYIIDIYRAGENAKPERNFWKFAGFIAFFPHLVAGPLTRHNQLTPQLERIAERGIRPRWREGVFLFAIGLSKKLIIGDTLGRLVNPLLESGSPTLIASWCALVGFTLQIYFDFSGYSDMAIGLGRLFDVELPMNFNSPYQAANPSDFWRRWHVTLSQWLRDYLYIPLGGNRLSAFRTSLNLMITMVLGGLWHGAGVTFLIWGAWHGSLLLVYRLLGRRWDGLPKGVQKGLTFFLVMMGWLPFRASGLQQMGQWFQGLVGVNGLGVFLYPVELGLALFFGLLMTLKLPEPSSHWKLSDWETVPQIALGLFTALGVMFLAQTSAFLYFQF
ncbi:MAG: MBOAT family protein [Deltaproteobacteria bacterium]|nr:MBOAT family protein [Deltaproteobacteria bacterium]